MAEGLWPAAPAGCPHCTAGQDIRCVTRLYAAHACVLVGIVSCRRRAEEGLSVHVVQVARFGARGLFWLAQYTRWWSSSWSGSRYCCKISGVLKLRNLTRFPTHEWRGTFIHIRHGISVFTAFCPNTLSNGLRSCLCAQDLGRGRERYSFIGHVLFDLFVRQHCTG